MILNNIKNCYRGSNKIKRIYIRTSLIYAAVTPAPPIVSEENILGDSSADTYEEGSTTWGDLTLSTGCETSKDGIEVQDEETYLSSDISELSYPMTFEFKGRIDESSYKTQDNNPGMLFGLGPNQDEWGNSITCYSTTDYGIIIDTTGAMTITTYAIPTYVHIIFTINDSGNLTMYMNGINNVWTAEANSAITSTKSYIYNGQGEGRFVGAINTIRWWNTELSISDITNLFASDSDEYTTL